MKKNFNYYLVIWLIALAVFNVIVFVTPAEMAGMTKFGGAFWSGYIFITLAFLGQLACGYRAFKAENLQKLFYNIPLITISYTGLVVTLIAGAACMAIPDLPNWVGVIVCLLILAFTAVSVVKAVAAAEIIGETDENIKTKTQFIKLLIAESEHLMICAKTGEIKEEAKKVYEAVRYSDPMSIAALNDVENQIYNKFSAFSDAVKTENVDNAKSISAELLSLIDLRNKKCKVMK